MVRGLLAILALVMLIGSSGLANGQEEAAVWEIGKADRQMADLAFPTAVGDYPKLFPQDIRFIVGKSDPLKEFCAVHPGPVDEWAGRRQHPFRIEFNLDAPPVGGYVLKIDLVDTHGDSAPTLRIDVNGVSTDQPLDKGAGDITLLRPDKGKPRALSYVFGADHLKQGANVVELRVVGGSWLLYDAVSLKKLPAGQALPMELAVKESMFLIEREGRFKQELSFSANGVVGSGAVTVQVHAGVDALEKVDLGRAKLGRAQGVIHVDEAAQPRQLTITVSVGDQVETTSLTQTPQRKWRIYVAPSTHTDIGYTDIQDRVIALHNRNTDLALELARDFPLYHWNLESSWAAQVWFADRPTARHNELYEASRGRRIGIESSYLNMLTGLCSEEELIRNLYYSARLHREEGVPFESHTITDAPSHVWTVPSILAGAGIRCVSIGVNQTRAPLFKQDIHHKSPFWWEGPDGQRVLTWFANGYSQAGQIGLSDGVERMRTAVEGNLEWTRKRRDYPYDAVLLHGAYSDNVAIGRQMAESITAYSQRYAYPKIILAANNDFFSYIEEHFADKIPTVRGCGGSWWEDGAGSSAVETAINRIAHQDVVTAEAIWATSTADGRGGQFMQRRFDRVWDNILLYDEHTWGAHNSISQPTLDFVQRQWAIKAAYATLAGDTAQRLIEDGLRRLAERISAPRDSVLVFNSSGRPRTSIVEVEIPRGKVILGESGPLPQQPVLRQDQSLGTVKVEFLASDVPAVGYRVYRFGPKTASPAAPKRFDGQVLENDFYRVTFDAKTGGVKSLVDKALDKDLVDATSPYTFGQLVYALGGEEAKGQTQVNCPDPSKVALSSPTTARLEAGAAGPLYTSVRSIAPMAHFPGMEMEVILYEHERRIDFAFRLNKQLTFEKEAVYLAFPVAGAGPQFRYEIGGGNVRPNEDQFPGACRDWFSVQRWVTVNTADRAVAWSPIDTPLVTFCQMTPGNWLDELPITNGTIFAYAMNNYWFTNYKAGQDGDFLFRYGLTSAKSVDPETASLFGESVAAPLRAIRVYDGELAGTTPPAAGFCRVEPANVTVTTVKRADDGKGIIVRVRETAGKPIDARVVTAFPGVSKASLCDLVERVQGPATMADGKTIAVKLPAYGMKTIRLE